MVNSVNNFNQNNTGVNTVPQQRQDNVQNGAQNAVQPQAVSSQTVTPGYQVAPNQYQTAPTQTPAPNYQTTVPQNVSGLGINCYTLDISKLSPEERQKYLAQPPVCNVTGANMPCYPAGYYVNNYANNNSNTVKKRVTILTDDYIKNLEQLLTSENSEYREYAAAEVIKRLDEDKTRFNNPQLNALVNKMVMDPFDHKVRGRGLYALENQLASGDANTMSVLQWIKQDPNILERDLGSVDKIMLQLSAQTKLTDAPITSGSTIVS